MTDSNNAQSRAGRGKDPWLTAGVPSRDLALLALAGAAFCRPRQGRRIGSQKSQRSQAGGGGGPSEGAPNAVVQRYSHAQPLALPQKAAWQPESPLYPPCIPLCPPPNWSMAAVVTRELIALRSPHLVPDIP